MSRQERWVLCKITTGEEVKIGDAVTTFRNEPCTYVKGYPPRHSGSQGKVIVSFTAPALGQRPTEREFFASVIGCHWLLMEEDTKYIS